MNYKFKKKPYAHQLTALEKSWNRQTYAYFMEMGTGKTKVLIDNIAMLYDKGKIDGANDANKLSDQVVKLQQLEDQLVAGSPVNNK